MTQEINWNLNINEIILNAIGDNSNFVIGKQLAMSQKGRDFYWITVHTKNHARRLYGWKLHVSVNLQDAPKVLDSVLYLLIKHNACFKVAGTINLLASLNNNPDNATQSGKFITIYPANDEQAIHLAKLLDAATRLFQSPRIMTDKQYAFNSSIYYRWGSFSPEYRQTLWGAILPIIGKTGGKEIFDIRGPHSSHNMEFNDIFNKSNNAVKEEHILKNRYWRCAQLSLGTSSEVFLCLDLIEKKRYVLKVGYYNSCSDTRGYNAVHRIKNEEVMLKKLSNYNISPKIHDAFESKQGDYFIVMEDIPGGTLHEKLLQNMVQCKFLSRVNYLYWSATITLPVSLVITA